MPQVNLPNGQTLNFPEGMSDDEMRQAIYSNFPEYKTGGDSQAEPDEAQGVGGMARDALAGAASGVGGAVQEAFKLPGQAMAAGKEVLTHPLRSALNVGAGIGEGAEGLANLPANVAQYFKRKGMAGDWVDSIPKIPENLGIEDALGLGQGQGEQVLRGLGGFVAPGGAVGKLGSGLSRSRKLAATGGLAAAGQNENPIKGAVEAAMLEKIAQKAPAAAKKMYDFSEAPMSAMFPSELSASELQKAASVAGDTETNLGQVLQNPGMSKLYENRLRSQPFSGVSNQMMRTRDALKTQGSDILQRLDEGVPDAVSHHIVRALKDAKAKAQQEKEINFKALNDRGEKIGLRVQRYNLEKAARAMGRDLAASDEIQAATPKEIKEFLSRHVGTDRDYNIAQSDLYRGILGDKAYEASVKGDMNKSRVFTTLKEALEKDIEDAIDNSRDDTLKQLRNTAFRHFKEEFAPFQKKDIRKFVDFGGDPDMVIDTFLKTGRGKDRGLLLKRLMDRMPPEAKKYIPASYYSRAIHPEFGINPMQLATLHNKLGENQRQVLHGSTGMLDEMNDYSRLVGMNKKAADIMWNPETGATLLAGRAPVGAAGIGAILAGNPGAVVGALAPLVGSRTAAKFLSSPKWRRKIIDRLSAEKTQKEMNMSASELNKLVEALKRWQSKNIKD